MNIKESVNQSIVECFSVNHYLDDMLINFKIEKLGKSDGCGVVGAFNDVSVDDVSMDIYFYEIKTIFNKLSQTINREVRHKHRVRPVNFLGYYTDDRSCVSDFNKPMTCIFKGSFNIACLFMADHLLTVFVGVDDDGDIMFVVEKRELPKGEKEHLLTLDIISFMLCGNFDKYCALYLSKNKSDTKVKFCLCCKHQINDASCRNAIIDAENEKKSKCPNGFIGFSLILLKHISNSDLVTEEERQKEAEDEEEFYEKYYAMYDEEEDESCGDSGSYDLKSDNDDLDNSSDEDVIIESEEIVEIETNADSGIDTKDEIKEMAKAMVEKVVNGVMKVLRKEEEKEQTVALVKKEKHESTDERSEKKEEDTVVDGVNTPETTSESDEPVKNIEYLKLCREAKFEELKDSLTGLELDETLIAVCKHVESVVKSDGTYLKGLPIKSAVFKVVVNVGVFLKDVKALRFALENKHFSFNRHEDKFDITYLMFSGIRLMCLESLMTDERLKKRLDCDIGTMEKLTKSENFANGWSNLISCIKLFETIYLTELVKKKKWDKRVGLIIKATIACSVMTFVKKRKITAPKNIVAFNQIPGFSAVYGAAHIGYEKVKGNLYHLHDISEDDIVDLYDSISTGAVMVGEITSVKTSRFDPMVKKVLECAITAIFPKVEIENDCGLTHKMQDFFNHVKNRSLKRSGSTDYKSKTSTKNSFRVKNIKMSDTSKVSNATATKTRNDPEHSKRVTIIKRQDKHKDASPNKELKQAEIAIVMVVKAEEDKKQAKAATAVKAEENNGNESETQEDKSKVLLFSDVTKIVPIETPINEARKRSDDSEIETETSLIHVVDESEQRSCNFLKADEKKEKRRLVNKAKREAKKTDKEGWVGIEKNTLKRGRITNAEESKAIVDAIVNEGRRCNKIDDSPEHSEVEEVKEEPKVVKITKQKKKKASKNKKLNKQDKIVRSSNDKHSLIETDTKFEIDYEAKMYFDDYVKPEEEPESVNWGEAMDLLEM